MTLRWTLPVAALCLLTTCSDYIDKLPGDYYYYSEGETDQVIIRENWHKGEPYIPCRVDSYAADGRFIVAKQTATERCFVEGTNPMADAAGTTFFWIIDSQQNKFLGPYRSRRDFDSMVAQLEIQASLD